MIIYQSTKAGFLDDAFGHDIEAVVLGAYQDRTGRHVAKTEIRAWRESLMAMAKVLRHESIPNDCGIAIEYVIPQTAKRIDLLMSGLDEQDRSKLIIIELKQWEAASKTNKDGLVRTRFSGGEGDTSHPSYQAWSYAELLRNFNEEVYSQDIPLQPCAYLHNFVDGAVLNDPIYLSYVELAPIFLSGQGERERLRAFIAQHVRRGDRGKLIVQIENGRIRPSRRLIDALVGMLQGKPDGIYRAAQRGASTHMRDRVEAVAVALRTADRVGEPGKLRLRESRRELEREWLATSEALRSQGQTALAEQARHFVRSLPPARTEREWLVAGLVEQVRREPAPREVERTR
jgi:hypothetical protein